jgi:hypothetical protein
MARHDIEPVLQQLVRTVNESGQAAVPVTVFRSRHHAERCPGRPAEVLQRARRGKSPMSALEPSSGLLGKDYAKETEAESGHHLHILTGPVRDGGVAAGLWRISLDAVDGWTLGAEAAADGEDDRGPFARPLGKSLTARSACLS